MTTKTRERCIAMPLSCHVDVKCLTRHWSVLRDTLTRGTRILYFSSAPFSIWDETRQESDSGFETNTIHLNNHFFLNISINNTDKYLKWIWSPSYYNLGHMLVDICEIWQKVLVREFAKSAYFRSAISESDNKWFSVEGLGTRLPLDTLTCLKPMAIWPKILNFFVYMKNL